MRALLLMLLAVTAQAEAPFKRWHYQLQKLENLVDKHAGDVDTLFVIDALKDGAPFSDGEMTRLKHGGKNRVLAYLSVGEAEDYRWYFKALPKSVLLDANPLFPGAFTVKYWLPSWQKVIALGKNSSLDQIQDAGFDGVYLDTVDVFYRFPKRATAASDMVKWIVEISTRAKRRDPKFLVVQQNASCLSSLTEKSHQRLMKDYWAGIDGIALESTFFFGEKWDDNDLKPQAEVLKCLKAYQEKQKWVVGVEYVRNPQKRVKAIEEMKRNGIIGLATDRHLTGEFFEYMK